MIRTLERRGAWRLDYHKNEVGLADWWEVVEGKFVDWTFKKFDDEQSARAHFDAVAKKESEK